MKLRTEEICTMMTAAALAVSPALIAAEKTWTGNGGDINFSTAANWKDGTAPAEGDTLCFVGMNVVASNDYGAARSFKSVKFLNDGTDGKTKPFTILGDTLRLTGKPAISFTNAVSAMTDIIASDVVVGTGCQFGILKQQDTSHSVLIQGSLTSLSPERLETSPQHGSVITFNNTVSNFTQIFRPNGGGHLVFRSPTNMFTTTEHNIREGALEVLNLAALGVNCSKMSFGQSRYVTPAYLYVTPAEDQSCGISFAVNGPVQTRNGGGVFNQTAGTRLTFNGHIEMGSTEYNNAGEPGNGTCFEIGGVGDGVIQDGVTGLPLALLKNGSGTWEINGVYSSTGLVTIAAGTLVMNADMPTNGSVNVSGTLRGTGTIHAATKVTDGGVIYGGTSVKFETMKFARAEGSALTLSQGAKIHVCPGDDGSLPLALDVDGTLEVNGVVTLVLKGGSLAPGRYPLISWTSKVGTGVFQPGEGFPENAVLTESKTGVTLVVSDSLTPLSWTGEESGVWDTSAANWSNGMLYEDDAITLFTDAANSEKTNVTISSEVRPSRVSVTGSANNYTFSGAGLAGDMAFQKSGGTSVLTMNNANSYTGNTLIDDGTLRLNGSITDSSIFVSRGAKLRESASGQINGTAGVLILGEAWLDGTNTFTGGLSIGQNGSSGRPTNTVTCAESFGAQGGTVSIFDNATLVFDGNNMIVSNRTLRLESTTMKICVNKSLTWAGDIVTRQIGGGYTFDTAGSLVFNVGTPGGTNTITDEGVGGYFTFRGSASSVNLYSRIDIGGLVRRTDYAPFHIYSVSNRWAGFDHPVGSVFLHAAHAMPPASSFNMGQTYNKMAFASVLDLNGFDQELGAVVIRDIDPGSTQTIKSDLPATLTLTCPTDCAIDKSGTSIKGAISLRKQGEKTLSVACNNTFTGTITIEAGILAATTNRACGYSTNIVVGAEGLLRLSHASALPPEKDARLTVEAGGVVEIDEDVTTEISKLTLGSKMCSAGTYGGPESNADRILRDWFTGKGVLRVTNGDAGLMLLFR